MAKNKAGIRILKGDEPLPFGFEEVEEGDRKEVPVSVIVRALIIGRSPENQDKIVLVFNARDTIGDRPRGWGMPGGRAKQGQSALDAFHVQEKGELRWALAADIVPSHLLTRDKVVRNNGKPIRIERTEVFLVVVDESHQIPITAEEAREVADAKFFSHEEIDKLASHYVDTSRGAVQPPEGQEGIYKFHDELLQDAYHAYQRLLENPTEGFSRMRGQLASMPA